MTNESNPNSSRLMTDLMGLQAGPPIFIMGIAPRSGTNFLHDLLLLHPDCDPDGRLLEEDHLIAHAHWLFRYINSVARLWKPRWGQEELRLEEQLLCEHLGNGLISFLSVQLESRRVHSRRHTGGKGRRLVTKTPSPV